MKINYGKGKKEKAEAGDLIKLNTWVGLVVKKRDGSDLTVAFFQQIDKEGDKVGQFEMIDGLQRDFDNEDYKIIAKARDWEINIFK